MEPKIVIEDWQGRHNTLTRAQQLEKEGLYKDCSTICICPTRGTIAARVVQNWMGMIAPMNQKFTRMFMIGMEVGHAYNSAIEQILGNPELSTWKFVMTLEEDNMVPPDALLKMIETLHAHPELSGVGGLYWTKGEGGQPMCYGDPAAMPKNFIPQVPPDNCVKEFNGLGMGCNLFRLEMFKRLEKPWFVTKQEYVPGQGVSCYTQDLYFYEQAGKHGHRFACDSRVKVGHYDVNSDIVW